MEDFNLDEVIVVESIEPENVIVIEIGDFLSYFFIFVGNRFCEQDDQIFEWSDLVLFKNGNLINFHTHQTSWNLSEIILTGPPISGHLGFLAIKADCKRRFIDNILDSNLN